MAELLNLHDLNCMLQSRSESERTCSWSIVAGATRFATAGISGSFHASLFASPLPTVACGIEDAMALLRLTGTSSAACSATLPSLRVSSPVHLFRGT